MTMLKTAARETRKLYSRKNFVPYGRFQFFPLLSQYHLNKGSREDNIWLKLTWMQFPIGGLMYSN